MRIESRLFIIILLLFLQLTSFSENVSLEKARIVAENFFTEKMQDHQQKVSIGKEYVISEAGETAYYVFNINNGFIIISADDVVFPVLGYSFTNNYKENNFPPAFKAWMHHNKEQILFAIEKKQVAPNQVKKAWLKYTSKAFQADLNFESVEPMIHTTWSQGCYYNSQFPADTTAPCGYLWTGCVATAMGQIMKYYNYPKSGTGSNGYNSSYGWVEADFENTEYDWAGMKNHLNEENYPVAELLYQAAISINSQFFPYGTGAYDFDARDALVDYFNYKSDAQFYWRDSYQGDWKAMLRTELDEERPFLYGGVDSETSAGHTLVCDGYQDTSFFHFNWGWNGYYDGYFYLDSLIAGGNHFDFQHDAVVGISPDINGVIELYPPENLSATVDFKEVTLNWENSSLPSSLELIGYYVFRNDTMLTESVSTELSYVDMDVPAGSHEYKVQSVFIGQGNGPSISTEAYISSISKHYPELSEVYPNPASDFIFIETTLNYNDQVTVSICDLNGRKVFHQDYTNLHGFIEIDIHDLNPGIYFLRIQYGNNISDKKLLIK